MDSVTQTGDTAFIYLSTRAEMVLPVTLELRYADGSTEMRDYPIEMWNLGPHFTARVGTAKRVVGVVVDPRDVYPDVDRANNRWGK